MATNPISELQAFHGFLQEKLNNGGADLTPEEALDEWRDLHPEPEDEEDDVAAIQAALDDVDRGERVISLEDLDQGLHAEFELRAPPKK